MNKLHELLNGLPDLSAETRADILKEIDDAIQRAWNQGYYTGLHSPARAGGESTAC